MGIRETISKFWEQKHTRLHLKLFSECSWIHSYIFQWGFGLSLFEYDLGFISINDKSFNKKNPFICQKKQQTFLYYRYLIEIFFFVSKCSAISWRWQVTLRRDSEL